MADLTNGNRLPVPLQDCVRILVLGDPGVGKTSLITTVISSDFQEKVPPKIPPVLIPRKKESDNINVRTEIIDTSSKPSDQQLVDVWISKADFICIVYDVNNLQTFNRIEQHWIPHIRKVNGGGGVGGKGRKVPIVVVGTKTDIRDVHRKKTFEELEKEMVPLMNKFDDIEYVFECSAREKDAADTIDELFWHAQYRVLYPRIPLCDADLNFTPEFVLVIKRIFHLVDLDKDGYLQDEDINRFQQMCTAAHSGEASLSTQSISQIKQIIQNSDPTGVTERGINEHGFLCLFHIILERGRTETIWNILRSFGYDNTLKLRECDYIPHVKMGKGDHVELSKEGVKFLTQLFMQYNEKNNASILTKRKLKFLFQSLCHEKPRHPWTVLGFPECCCTFTFTPDEDGDNSVNGGTNSIEPGPSTTTPRGHSDDAERRSIGTYSYSISESDLEEEGEEAYDSITLKTWLALWATTTFYDYKVTLKYLAYLGFGMVPFPLRDERSEKAGSGGEGERSWGWGRKKIKSDLATHTNKMSQAITTTRLRTKLPANRRSVFLCYIFGSIGSGKHTLLRSFINKQELEGPKTLRTSDDVIPKPVKLQANIAVNSLQNDECLILEIPTEKHEETISLNQKVPNCLQNTERMRKADAYLLLYDTTHQPSFQYIFEVHKFIQKKYPHIPAILVGTKGDLPPFTLPSGKASTPSELSKQYKLSHPPIIIKNKQPGTLFQIVIDHILETRKTKTTGKTILFVGSLLAFLCIGAFSLLNNNNWDNWKSYIVGKLIWQ